ncbi:taste receptor type 2 member 7-like [Rhinatrema bivittatum]|uniref:taste receptor type 2 member 7-like n=1 Tax=Rhinatrema bivittatum TaxID=194408 RepID=UPI001128A65F|nr:taste receptor type 2 member 7-like [Rhinatrema bivittatum]
MLSTVQTVTLIILAAFTALGSVVNGFIVAVNGIDWVKSRHLNSIDVILTCLAAARFCFQWGMLLESILIIVYPDLLNQAESANKLLFTWVFLDLSSFWFACCLSVFYCTKIASFSHPLFIFLKLKIPGIVPWMLLGSVLASIVTSIPTAWGLCKLYHSNSTTGLFPNNSNVINCTLAWELCKEHQYNFTKRITPNAGGLNGFWMSGESPWTLIFSFGIAAYPALHSVILILSNCKLRQSWARILHHGKCPSGRETSQTINQDSEQ